MFREKRQSASRMRHNLAWKNEDPFLKWEVLNPNSKRKGILMAVQFTREALVPIAGMADSREPLDELRDRVERAVQRFRSAPLTPQSFLDLENELDRLTQDACRQILEQEANRAEPDDK